MNDAVAKGVLVRHWIKASVLIFTTLVCGAHAATSLAQHDVGTGGDPLMLIFSKAKADAAHMVRTVAAAPLPAGIDADVREFLLAVDPSDPRTHLARLAEDIEASDHLWSEGDVFHERCAATNIPPDRQAVHLSITRCRAALLTTSAGESEAVRLLIHEATHHLGLTGSPLDEDKASRVGITLHSLWLRLRRSDVPRWSETALLDVPEARYEHTSVWTGDVVDQSVAGRLIIWGGCNYSELPFPQECAHYLNTGAKLAIARRGIDGSAPATTWQPMSSATAPLGRSLHTAVWTGEAAPPSARNKMIIFGGCRGDEVVCDQAFAVTACPGGGGATCSDPKRDHVVYDPASDLWTPASSEGAPTPRVFHTSVWTNFGMIVWGGLEGYRNPAIADKALADGGILSFDQAHPQGQWTPIPPPPSDTLSARYGHTAIWSGQRLYVWGGCDRPGLVAWGCARYYNDGASYDPSTGNWTKLPPVPGNFESRFEHSMVWDGRNIVLWGGRNGSGALKSGAKFDTALGTWSLLPTDLPSSERARYRHTAVWDGLQGRMIVWGGHTRADEFPQSTLILARDEFGVLKWSTVPTDIAPIGRKGHTGHWVRDALVVWGGYGEDETFLYTGGILNP